MNSPRGQEHSAGTYLRQQQRHPSQLARRRVALAPHCKLTTILHHGKNKGIKDADKQSYLTMTGKMRREPYCSTCRFAIQTQPWRTTTLTPTGTMPRAGSTIGRRLIRAAQTKHQLPPPPPHLTIRVMDLVPPPRPQPRRVPVATDPKMTFKMRRRDRTTATR